MPSQKLIPAGEQTPSVLSCRSTGALSAVKNDEVLLAGSLQPVPVEKASAPAPSFEPGEEIAPSSVLQTATPRAKRTLKRSKSRQKAVLTLPRVAYQPEFCERLLAFFDVPPFKVTEVQKKDGSIMLLETASELPTFAAFARTLGVTQAELREWEHAYPAFAEAAKKARDLQGDILIQNSLRGNYSASFAVFTAKNLLGWSDGKEENKKPLGTVVVRWEKE